MTVRLRHYTPAEAALVASSYPGHAIVEVITPAGAGLVAIPVNDKTRDLELPGMPGMTPDLLLGSTTTIDTRPPA